MVTSDMRSRARGCLLGQLIGDAPGSQVEFLTPDRIATIYPEGVRELENGRTWGTLAVKPISAPRRERYGDFNTLNERAQENSTQVMIDTSDAHRKVEENKRLT